MCRNLVNEWCVCVWLFENIALEIKNSKCLHACMWIRLFVCLQNNVYINNYTLYKKTNKVFGDFHQYIRHDMTRTFNLMFFDEFFYMKILFLNHLKIKQNADFFLVWTEKDNRFISESSGNCMEELTYFKKWMEINPSFTGNLRNTIVWR